MSDHEFYVRDGLQYARISTILGATMALFHPDRAEGLAIWQQREPNYQEILANSQRRGTILHYMNERYLLGDQANPTEKPPSVEELTQYNIGAYMNYLEPLLEEIKESNAGSCSLWPGLSETNLLVEQELYCPYGFAGKPDLRLWWNQKYTIWDWKSSRSILEQGVAKKRKPRSKFSEGFIQMSAYALAHNILSKETGEYPPIEQIVICACYDWCEPTLFIEPIEGIRELAAEFIERYKIYQEIEDSSFPRPAPISPCPSQLPSTAMSSLTPR
jgi:hypothetical protein